jgi:Amt family ammonium transporter
MVRGIERVAHQHRIAARGVERAVGFALPQGSDALFILLGAIMVLAMHAGFAFLELGTVRKKNQVNALVKILVDFSVSTVVYFVVGYSVAYGTHFFVGAETWPSKTAMRW